MEKKDLDEILSLAFALKKNVGSDLDFSESLAGKSLVMLFQKTSTRTRLSFELGMTQLGGHAAFLEWKASNFQVGDVMDEVKCIGRYADALMARVYSHTDLENMAKAAGIPTINGLSDYEHPCQALADIMTIKEKFDYKPNVAYVGDGNNVCNSLIAACMLSGINISVATPKGYEPAKKITDKAIQAGILTLRNDPYEAVKGTQVVYTDTWVSLGQESEAEERIKAFRNYQVNSALVPKDALVMHCLPAHRGYEITDEVIDGPNSIVFDQAENRMHVQKAVLLKLIKGDGYLAR